MQTITVSPKYQIVIPRELRERLGIVPGTQLMVLAQPSGFRLVPVKPIEEWEGALPGIPTEVEQDDEP